MMISALLWLCLQGTCIEVTPHAMAVAACESGDTVTLGTGAWDAYNDNSDGSTDGGAWQINDYWVWSTDDLWVIEPFAKTLGMTGKEFEAEDMYAALVALKLSRHSYNYKQDNLLDACAYIGALDNYIKEKQ